MRESRRCRRWRGHNLVHRRHRRNELAPGGRGIFRGSRYVIRQARLCRAAGAESVEHVAGDAGRRGHVLVGRGHRVGRYRNVGEVISCRFTVIV